MLNSAPIAALKVLSISQCKMWLIFPAARYLITEHIFGIIINSWQHGMLLFHKIPGKQLGVQQWEWLCCWQYLRNRGGRGCRFILSRCGSTLLFLEHAKGSGRSASFGKQCRELSVRATWSFSLCRPAEWCFCFGYVQSLGSLHSAAI